MTSSIFLRGEDYSYVNYLRDIYRTIGDKDKGKIIPTLCDILKVKYDNCITLIPIEPNIDIPGRPERGPPKEGIEIPPDVDDYDKTPLPSDRKVIIFNEEKTKILNQALALGCDWAKEELKKLKVLKVKENKDLFKWLD